MIQILPEDLDKAIAACLDKETCHTQNCLLAQVGKRLEPQKVIVGCSYGKINFTSGMPLCVNHLVSSPLVHLFDDLCAANPSKRPALHEQLRNQLPADITP